MADFTGRFKNIGWKLSDEHGQIPDWERVQVAVLMDIRDELKNLNALLHCKNFQDIPGILRQLQMNTRKPKRKSRKPASGGE